MVVQASTLSYIIENLVIMNFGKCSKFKAELKRSCHLYPKKIAKNRIFN